MAADAIHLENIRFSWHRQEPLVLDIADFRVAEGERVFLKGPSGSGKTTLLNLLGGITVPQQGMVKVLETDLVALSGAKRDAYRADHIGFIFQMFNLVPYLSLVENVLLPCRFSARRRKNAGSSASQLEAEACRFLDHMELGGVQMARRAVARLSVGQQQRVAVARALIGAPSLVIADEPTSALDADARGHFLDLLFRETQGVGATLLFVSHDSSLESAFDRTVTLADINRATARAA
ncbi:MAG: ABC transporter ATP-binding protein [Magnetospiraceae bacterium]